MILVPILLAAACSGCSAPPADAVPIEAVCSASDGDTLRCGDERIRLLGIDAPELPGHCREGRVCAQGDPVASRESLAEMVGDGAGTSSTAGVGRPILSIRRFGQDRYGRTLAVVYSGKLNLSCAQIERGRAIYRRDWDNKGAVRADCPAAAE